MLGPLYGQSRDGLSRLWVEVEVGVSHDAGGKHRGRTGSSTVSPDPRGFTDMTKMWSTEF